MDPLTPAHDRHDLLLIAAFASDDAVGRDRERAEALVASCPDCALLVADLRAIGSATAALPAVERTRDFRLSPSDAARLRPSGWRRAIGWLRGGPAAIGRSGATRPLAIGLTTLGLVGLVLSATPLAGLGGSTASAPQALDESAGGRNSQVTGAVNDSGATAGPALGPVDAGAGAAPSPAGPPGFAAGQGPSPVPTAAPELAISPGASSTAGSLPVLAIASLGCLVVGLALFLLARSRGRTVDPD